MTPSAESNAPAVELTVHPDLLQDGEEVILAVKPSGWFVVLVSWPVLAGCAVVAVGVYVATEVFRSDLPRQTVLLICLAVACVRIMLGCFQWMGCVYVLTNLRVLRIRGVLRADVFECPLKRVRETLLSSMFLERVMGLGSLFFILAGTDAPQVGWNHLSRPEEIQQTVIEAIRRAR
jgi:hypothetical protein